MNNKPPGFNAITSSTPPEEALERYNNELKHYTASIRGCAQVLAMNPSQDMRQRTLDIITFDLDRIEILRESIETYLKARLKRE